MEYAHVFFTHCMYICLYRCFLVSFPSKSTTEEQNWGLSQFEKRKEVYQEGVTQCYCILIGQDISLGLAGVVSCLSSYWKIQSSSHLTPQGTSVFCFSFPRRGNKAEHHNRPQGWNTNKQNTTQSRQGPRWLFTIHFVYSYIILLCQCMRKWRGRLKYNLRSRVIDPLSVHITTI